MPLILEEDEPLPSLLYWRYSPKTPDNFRPYPAKDTYHVGTHFSQVQQLQLPPPEEGLLYDPKQSAPALAFDSQNELLWVGNESVSNSSASLGVSLKAVSTGQDNFILWRRPTEVYVPSGASI